MTKVDKTGLNSSSRTLTRITHTNYTGRQRCIDAGAHFRTTPASQYPSEAELIPVTSSIKTNNNDNRDPPTPLRLSELSNLNRMNINRIWGSSSQTCRINFGI